MRRFSRASILSSTSRFDTSDGAAFALHAAEPDKGYDTKAAEWRAKLAETEEETESE